MNKSTIFLTNRPSVINLMGGKKYIFGQFVVYGRNLEKEKD
jgi:hypothetical protein